MGKKKGGGSQGGADRTLSLIDAANKVVKPFVMQQIQLLGQQLQQEQTQTLRALYTRLTTLEDIIQKNFDISDEQLAELVADTEDKGYGLVKVEGEAEEGDTLRITVGTKLADQEEFQGESKLIVDSVGIAPFTVGPDLEPQLIGMQAGDVKEVAFGEDGKMVARLEVNRVARRPKVETPEVALKPVEKDQEGSDANAG